MRHLYLVSIVTVSLQYRNSIYFSAQKQMQSRQKVGEKQSKSRCKVDTKQENPPYFFLRLSYCCGIRSPRQTFFKQHDDTTPDSLKALNNVKFRIFYLFFATKEKFLRLIRGRKHQILYRGDMKAERTNTYLSIKETGKIIVKSEKNLSLHLKKEG